MGEESKNTKNNSKDYNEFLKNLTQTVSSNLSLLNDNFGFINGKLCNLNLLESKDVNIHNFLSKYEIKKPKKLYKYFPNQRKRNPKTEKLSDINYSIQALKKNTVYLQKPEAFDDIYDSSVHIEYEKFRKLRLLRYCIFCNLPVNGKMSAQELHNALLNHIRKCFYTQKNLNSLFKKEPDTEIEKLAFTLFITSMTALPNIIKNIDFNKALNQTIKNEYNSQTQFRVSCFTTTPYSQLMWGGSYADNHKGFCVEYTLLPKNPQYREIYKSLFPMIYCKIRPDVTEKLKTMLETSYLPVEDLKYLFFHGVLRKSIDWFMQDEWRLLNIFDHKNFTNGDKDDYNVKFFPITKVYLGIRMEDEEKEKIIKICEERNIEYVEIAQRQDYFELTEKPIK